MKIQLHGTEFEVADGLPVSIVDCQITIGDRNVGKVSGNIFIIGNTGPIRLDRGSATIGGLVNGDIDAGGSVRCGSVTGSVDAGGSVSAGDVGGDVDAGGSITCGKVAGSVDAGGSVVMKN